MLVYSDSDGRKHYGFKPLWSIFFCKNCNETWSSASYLNQTHVNCLEVCYATTISTMLRNSHIEKGQHQGFIIFCNKYHSKNSINVIASVSYGTLTHVKNACKATMLPLHQRRLLYRTWKKENRRIENSSVSKSDKKSLLTPKLLHPAGIGPLSIAWKFTMLPLHQRWGSTQTCTVE